MSYGFRPDSRWSFTNNVMEWRRVILWFKAFFWGKMQFPFLKGATSSLQCSADSTGAHYRLSVINYEPIFFGLTNVLFHVCPMNIVCEDFTRSIGPLLMFVCHNNVFVVCLFYWLCLFFPVPISDIFEDVLHAELQTGLHYPFIYGALCDQSVVPSCITCLCLTIAVKLNKPF